MDLITDAGLESNRVFGDRHSMASHVPSTLECWHTFHQWRIPQQETAMRGSGGTPGGTREFAIGFVLAGIAVYLFLDSVVVSTGIGVIASGMNGLFGGILGDTTSSGLVFLPFFVGVTALFYDARPRWSWITMSLGIAIIVFEIMSRIRFLISMKVTHLLGIVVLLAAGTGLMLRSYRDQSGDP